MNKFKKAITICDIIIAMTIIGIVGIYVLPAFLGNSNVTAWAKQKDNFEARLDEVAKQMNANQILTGYSTNEAFLDNVQKYLKLSKRCTSSNLTDCFVSSFKTSSGDTINTSSLTTGASIGKTTNTSAITGAQLSDGVNAIVAYDPTCTPPDWYNVSSGSSYNSDAASITQKYTASSAASCFSMVYDVNGSKGPNQVDKDIKLFNASVSACTGAQIGSICVETSDTAYTRIDTCTDTTYDTNLTANSFCSNNAWAAAKKVCDLKGMRLPSKTELLEIRDNFKRGGNTAGMNSIFYYWTSDEYTTPQSKAWHVHFSTTSELIPSGMDKSYGGKARCVK
ncbi:MAG: hypothetical protein PHC64_03710 [Candidatus Gastranaerophilales bacterium]|nr:hypothetical protein [Candidatus Gastranaerophilales bacterium]